MIPRVEQADYATALPVFSFRPYQKDEKETP